MKKVITIVLSFFILVSLTGCGISQREEKNDDNTTSIGQQNNSSIIDLENIPEFSNSPYVEINHNTPFFSSEELTTEAFEKYTELDSLGRCGVAYANICIDIMPTEERESIGMIKPSGWHTVRYDDLVDGKYLYNRCHLIGFQLAGENANQQNLITGTRYLNTEGMLPYENEVADYVKKTNNHVLYRITPIFKDDELVARGVLMEAYSVEDSGEGIRFCVYCYNSQPGIVIDYLTGESKRDTSQKNTQDDSYEHTYVLNKNTMTIHVENCSSVSRMKDKYKKISHDKIDSLIDQGYKKCQNCNPD